MTTTQMPFSTGGNSATPTPYATGANYAPDITVAAPRLDPVAAAWHDVTCPEGQDCRTRHVHAMSATMVTTGLLGRFLARLRALEAVPGDKRLHEPYDRSTFRAPPSR